MNYYKNHPQEILKILDLISKNNLRDLKLYLNKDNINLIYDYIDGDLLSWISPEEEYYDMLSYLLDIGFNPNYISDRLTIIFGYILNERDLNNEIGLELDDKNIRLLVKYGADINYICNYSSWNIKDYINKSTKETPLDFAIGRHEPAKNYLLSIGAKTARELEKEEILSKENRNEYEELIYNCFTGDLDKVKNQIKTEYEKGFEGYIYSPIIASLESENTELMSFLLKYTIDMIFSNEENKVKFQDKNLFKTYLRNLFYNSNLQYHEKIMEIYKMNFEQNITE